MKVKFWGAAKTVTGSMHLLEIEGGPRILLDCGLFQGEDFAGEDLNIGFPCDPSLVDILVLSHAHVDHCGNIPQFVKLGFKGKIYCTPATLDLVRIMLEDSAEIQEKDAEHDNRWRSKKGLPLIVPLYTIRDVEPALNKFESVSYAKWTTIAKGVELMYVDAGHMLGSASVSLRIKEKGRLIRFGFTGDVGRPHRPILHDPQPMPQADFLISESTYGGKDHEPIDEAEEKLLAIIHEACVQKKGKLMIPAFSVGRTQDIVYTLEKLEKKGRLPHIPVFVDSPMATDATDVYKLHPECFDDEMIAFMRTDPNPFGFKRLQYVREAKDSKALNGRKEPMIIIASSGMANAGRIQHHLFNNIEDDRNTVLIVGYCAEGTLGSKLVNGAEQVKIFGDLLEVRASIKRMGAYSAHAGQTELYEFLSSQNPAELKKLWFVHGEEERSIAMQKFMESKGYTNIHVPSRGESFEI